MDKFSAFATGEPDLFQVLKDEFSLDPTANLKARGQVASFVAAWKASKTRVQEAGGSRGGARYPGMDKTHHASASLRKDSWGLWKKRTPKRNCWRSSMGSSRLSHSRRSPHELDFITGAAVWPSNMCKWVAEVGIREADKPREDRNPSPQGLHPR